MAAQRRLRGLLDGAVRLAGTLRTQIIKDLDELKHVAQMGGWQPQYIHRTRRRRHWPRRSSSWNGRSSAPDGHDNSHAGMSSF